VKKKMVTDALLLMKNFELDSKWLLLAPIHLEEWTRKLEDSTLQQGFAEFLINEMVRLDEIYQIS
jgi:excinuclease ABC subunit A